MKTMQVELLNVFDMLAPYCEVSARLCEEAGLGALDNPIELHALCTLLDLPLARSADLERALIAGQSCGLFEKATFLTWKVKKRALAQEVAPLLMGTKLYCSRVHQDANIVDVVLTRPPSPSHISEQLENMFQNYRSFRDTKQLLPVIAESARKSFGVMTPFIDDVGAQIVLNLFKLTKAPDKYLILRTNRYGEPPSALATVGEELSRLGVSVVNFHLDRSDAIGNETFHAKVILADDSAAYVGSSNMNQWSFAYSLELGLHVRGEAAAKIATVIQAVREVSLPMI